MKILFATPCFGGILTARYMQSFLQTMELLNSRGHDLSLLLVERDASISRARNSCATLAFENGFDKLLFVDADTVWSPEQVLILLESKKEIIGGTYPYKAMPIKLNLHPLLEHSDAFGADKKSFEAFKKYSQKYAEENGEIEVLRLPMGFMLIDVSVFKKLAETTPLYLTWDAPTNTQKNVYEFFPMRLIEVPDSEIRLCETEDWGFCSIAQKAGFKVHLQTKCIVDHLGFHQFSVVGG